MFGVHLVGGVGSGDADGLDFGGGAVEFRGDVVFFEAQKGVEFAVFNGIFTVEGPSVPCV